MSTDAASPKSETVRIGSFVVHRAVSNSEAEVIGAEDGAFPGARAIARSIPLPDSPDGRARLEVRLAKLRHLGHGAINPILESGCTDAIAYWIEAVPNGDPLRNQMDHEKWPISRVTGFIGRLGAALQIAHELGLSHGAITPASVYLHADGSPFLSGLGIKAHEPARDQSGLARVAIDLLAEKPWTDAGTDTEATGAWPDVRTQRLRESLSTCTLRVVNVLGKATDPDPAQRYASVSAFATEFDAAVKASAEDLVHSAFEAISGQNHDLARLMAEKAERYDPHCDSLALLTLQLRGGSPFAKPAAATTQESPVEAWSATPGGLDVPATPVPGLERQAAAQTLLPPELTEGLPQEFLDAIAPQFEVKPVKKGMHPLFVLAMGGAGLLLLLVAAGLATFVFAGR